MPHLKFKRHYKLLLLLALVVAVLIAGVGNQRIVAYSLQGTEQVVEAVITNGHTPAAPDSSRVPGSVQAWSPVGSK